MNAGTRCVIMWYHDKSTFYVHDRWIVYWQKTSRKGPKPKPKGKDVLLMVADFVSADYGWLTSLDSAESARVLFKAGKNCEGYFTNENILEQAKKAMNILQCHYPNEDYIFIYNNASTHLKRSPIFFSAKVPITNRATGKPVYGLDGQTALTKKIPMAGAKFADGSLQSLYFLFSHKRAGVFKSMKNILQEHRIDVTGLRAQCDMDFKCEPPTLNCCCHWILFNQPDFAKVKFCLETHCEKQGFRALFFPKFHCELNPIEQCWRHSKHEYRMYPESSLKADLECNVVKALRTVSVISICRFFTCMWRFIDGYRYGLTGKVVAYAEKKYCGHRALPRLILKDSSLRVSLR
ncbi:uncharacterized protein PHACADRAFT_109434 [Phanerochaete carnosa HHB-10118-sp]|uniref:Tc1-like transposase DDE domain-containing protein n=1 Tax=Phanerochaete carnosa (strain HHB-10118-sp) TaxID=650164 RepID=K5VAF6_PHACS|nr:uncharacterized protein PHACADRAFT_109434 [Phanerochaete carnosa HHB-10118-sp]EKM48073.1 hypothetical protein PHACADRAFT_109434 [Phanerochaete carnosa HHB-10118-sp]